MHLIWLTTDIVKRSTVLLNKINGDALFSYDNCLFTAVLLAQVSKRSERAAEEIVKIHLSLDEALKLTEATDLI